MGFHIGREKQVSYLNLPRYRAVEDVAGYVPPLLATSCRHQKLLCRYTSSDNLLHFVQVRLSWFSSAYGSSYSSWHNQDLQPVLSHYMTEKLHLTLTNCNKELSSASNARQNIHVASPLGPTNSQHSPPAPHLSRF